MMLVRMRGFPYFVIQHKVPSVTNLGSRVYVEDVIYMRNYLNSRLHIAQPLEIEWSSMISLFDSNLDLELDFFLLYLEMSRDRTSVG